MKLGDSGFRHDGAILGLALVGERILTASHEHPYTAFRLWDDRGRLLRGPLRVSLTRVLALTPARAWVATEHGLLSLEEEAPPILPLSDVVGVALSPDARRLAVATSRDLTLWDLDEGKPVWTIPDRQSPHVQPVFSADGRRLAAFPFDQGALVLDADGREVWRAPQVETWIGAALLDDLLVLPHNDGNLYLWPLGGGERQTVPAHRHGAFRVAVHGELLASTGWDGRVCLWNHRSWERLHDLRHEGAREVALAGDRMVTGGLPGDVRIWQQGELLSPPAEGHRGAVTAVCFRPSGALVSGGEDGLLRGWESDGFRLEAPGPVVALALSSDGRWLACGSSRELRVFDLQRGRDLALPPTPHGAVRRGGDLGFSADSRLLIGLLCHDTLCVWDLEDGRQQARYDALGENFYHAADSCVGADGRVLLAEPGGLGWWDWRSGQRTGGLAWPEQVLRVALGPARAAFGTFEGQLVEWETPGGEPRELSREPGAITALTYAPDGRLVAASQAGRLWIPGGWETQVDSLPLALAVSPDGRRLACGQANGVISLHDI